MVDGIIIAVIILAVFMAIRYIVKEKVRGRRCIGCPISGCCNRKSTKEHE